MCEFQTLINFGNLFLMRLALIQCLFLKPVESLWFGLVLFCFVLFCFVLFCFVLFCFVLFCFSTVSLPPHFHSVGTKVVTATLWMKQNKRNYFLPFTENDVYTVLEYSYNKET